MIAPWLKTTNELRGVNTDKGGSYETDFEELKLKAIYLHDFKPFGIKAKLALGAEWLKDLGDFDKGTAPRITRMPLPVPTTARRSIPTAISSTR